MAGARGSSLNVSILTEQCAKELETLHEKRFASAKRGNTTLTLRSTQSLRKNTAQ